MLEKLESCFERLQKLDIVPTLQNMEKLVQCLYEIRDVYNEIERLVADGHDGHNTNSSE